MVTVDFVLSLNNHLLETKLLHYFFAYPPLDVSTNKHVHACLMIEVKYKMNILGIRLWMPVHELPCSICEKDTLLC